MDMFEKLRMIRGLKKGAILSVCKPFEARAGARRINLPPGTRVLVESTATGDVDGIANVGGELVKIWFGVGAFHCVDMEPS